MDKLWKGIFYCEIHLERIIRWLSDRLRRFLDVGQSISSASPRVRACKHPLEHRPQFCVFRVPRRILEDNRARVGRYRPPEVSPADRPSTRKSQSQNPLQNGQILHAHPALRQRVLPTIDAI